MPARPRWMPAAMAAATLLTPVFSAHAQPGPRASAAVPAPDPPPAAPPKPAKRPKVSSPRIQDAPRVPYPKGGKGNAEVVLVLVIGKDGTVRSAEVEEGREPFASAAREAAQSFRFDPARRGGKAVAAKIRYAVGFVEERVVKPAPEPEPAPEDAPPKVAAIEVTVEGLKHPPSVTSMTRTEVRELPGAFGDPFRAIEIMPGVTPIASGLPFFYVRGAPPGNIGYFLDGVRVPYLFHAAAGPSVVHPAIVDRVDLYSGGYPAMHGRFAGAVVSAETTAPRTDWHGEGSIRLVDAGAFVEGGFDEGRGSVLLAGRYSYTAGLFSLISPEITLDYRDYQARISYDITPRDRVSVFAFGAFDFLSQTQVDPLSGDDIENVLFGAEFYRVDARYDVRLEGGGSIRTAVTWGFDQTKIADGRNTQDLLGGARVELTRPLDKTLTLRGGVNLQLDDYSATPRQYVDPDDPENEAFNGLFPPRRDGAAAAWADLRWTPTKRFEVTPGVRVDTFTSGAAKAIAVDPRLAVVAKVHPRVRLLHAVGMAHQPPSFVVPVPGLQVANLNGGLQRSLQASAGVEVNLPFAITATVTAFDGVYLNMTDSIGTGSVGDADERIPRSLGGAKGLEVYVRRSLSRNIGGFISYTLSRTDRSVGGEKFASAFDRTHVLHSALGFNLGSGWRAGTRFSIYSGTPVIRFGGVDPTADFSEAERDPVFYRLDLRFEKKWRINERIWISAVLEAVNATLNTETLNGNEVGPVSIPSIGVEAGF